MFWMAFLAMGMKASETSQANVMGEAQQNQENARAKFTNEFRDISNIEKGAKGSLARWMQNENNNRVLAAAGRAEASAKETRLRTQDAVTARSLEQQVANMERAGAYAANVAFSGAAGGSVSTVSRAMRLRNERQARALSDQAGFVDYEQIKQIAGVMPQAIDQLQINTFTDSIDYQKTLPNQVWRERNVLGESLMAGASKLDKNDIQDIKDWFK